MDLVSRFDKGISNFCGKNPESSWFVGRRRDLTRFCLFFEIDREYMTNVGIQTLKKFVKSPLKCAEFRTYTRTFYSRVKENDVRFLFFSQNQFSTSAYMNARARRLHATVFWQ